MHKPYLEFHKRCMKRGYLINQGLCSYFEDDNLFNLFDPEFGAMLTYWGYGEDYSHVNYDVLYKYTPLRQTIVLFMAAMNNEL